MPFADERQLVNSILGGDQGAFEELVNGYRGVVYGTLRRFRQLSKGDADGLFQDVFLRLIENEQRALRAWNGRSLGAYLKRITGNVAIDFLRQRREHIYDSNPDDLPESTTPADEDLGPEGQILLEQLRRMMNDAIRHLSSDDQLVVRLLYFEDLSYIEIAERLSISVNTTGARISRARQRLTETIRREFPALLEYL